MVCVLTVQMLVFVWHAKCYSHWLVDDSGISFAYAMNLADGHGLVAQVSDPPVEGFSNPSWVLLLAAARTLRLFGNREVFGSADVVVVIKAIGTLFHLLVLLCIGYLLSRVSDSATLGSVRTRTKLLLWLLAGCLLAANPSYVIWMVSGLENPLLALLVAAMAATAARFACDPRRVWMVILGTLAGLAAMTRPDGAAYLAMILVVALPVGTGPARRWSLAGIGLAAFAALFGTYLLFRWRYFGAILPNTAIAKSQGIPSVQNLRNVTDLVMSFTLPLSVLTLVGVAFGFREMARTNNAAGLRVGAAALLAVLTSLSVQVVLEPDWMGESRFATPVWPLLTLAAVLGMSQLAQMASSTGVRWALLSVLVMSVGLALSDWSDRTKAFVNAPTVPLCAVAENMGEKYNQAARTLGLDPGTTSLLTPDIGGALLTTDLHVVDLAGLIDRKIATYIRDGDSHALASHILTEIRPTFINVHDTWIPKSGLLDDPRFRTDYLQLGSDRDWIRREVVPDGSSLDEVIGRFRAHKVHEPANAERCDDLLLAGMGRHKPIGAR